MRGFGVLLLALSLLVPVANAQVPRGVLAEDATATWCQYCPYAYAGLEVMKSTYDVNEFAAVRYYATSGALGTPETDARIAYYGVTGYPTVVFDGTTPVVGGSAETATGSIYDPIVVSEIAKPSSLMFRVNSVDLVQPDGSVNFDVVVAETMADIGNVKIRAILCENNVAYSAEMFQDVTRDVLPDNNLTVSQLGQVQNVVINFPVNPTWKVQDLWIALFVQDDDNKSILQVSSTRPTPAYSMRFWTKGSRVAVRPSTSLPYEFQDFAVFNWGSSPDVIRVTLENGVMPAGWDCVFTDGVNDFSGSVDLALNPGESRIFRLKVTPGSPGYVAPELVLTSANIPGRERYIRYTVITDDVAVLLVDDDGGESFEDYHSDAIAAAGTTYGIWPTGSADVTAAALANFPIVVWEIGLFYPTLTATDRAALGTYLDGGGRLFITGQDLGWEMDDLGGTALAWYHQYLHANFMSDDTNRNNVAGVAGDPIGNGITLSLTGGDGASNNIYPDRIDPLDTSATTILNYTGSPLYSAALKVDTPAYRVVYLGFGFEAISTQANRRLLMQRVLAWLQPPAAVESDQPLAGLNLRVFPNPAQGSATLSYALPARGDARLEIYAPDGSLVRRLAEGTKDAGTHAVTWDGKNESGNPVPSGVYFYRLESGSQTPTGKLVLTR